MAAPGADAIVASAGSLETDEDMFQVSSPSGVIIDVGWYRSAYGGAVVYGDSPEAWAAPLEEFTSTDALDMVAWVERMGDKYK